MNNDDVNIEAMRSAAAIAQYAWQDALTLHERASLDIVAESASGKPILDIGVGGGRTVSALRAVSGDCWGIDYSPEMLAVCNALFPGVCFTKSSADANDRNGLSIANDGVNHAESSVAFVARKSIAVK